jgi:hypothetical protein
MERFGLKRPGPKFGNTLCGSTVRQGSNPVNETLTDVDAAAFPAIR